MDSSDEVYIIIPYLYLIIFHLEPDVTCFLFERQKEGPSMVWKVEKRYSDVTSKFGPCLAHAKFQKLSEFL